LDPQNVRSQYGIRKKALRKFACRALKNEIEVTAVWQYS
jgi:hypothetical protein